MTWTHTLPMPPKGKARPRVTKRGTFMPPEYQAWQREAVQRLKLAWRKESTQGPLRLTLVLVVPRPQKKPKTAIPPEAWATGQRVRAPRSPDVDNAAGSVMDAMEKAGIVRNDTAFTDLVVSRWWAARGERAHIKIELTSMPWTVT